MKSSKTCRQEEGKDLRKEGKHYNKLNRIHKKGGRNNREWSQSEKNTYSRVLLSYLAHQIHIDREFCDQIAEKTSKSPYQVYLFHRRMLLQFGSQKQIVKNMYKHIKKGRNNWGRNTTPQLNTQTSLKLTIDLSQNQVYHPQICHHCVEEEDQLQLLSQQINYIQQLLSCRSPQQYEIPFEIGEVSSLPNNYYWSYELCQVKQQKEQDETFDGDMQMDMQMQANNYQMEEETQSGYRGRDEQDYYSD